MSSYFVLLAISDLSDGLPLSRVPVIFADMRQRAVANGLTGVMVFDGAGFCLYMEGDRDLAMELYEVGRSDRRHDRLEAVSHGPCTARRFDGFRTGYALTDGEPASEQLRELDGDAALQRFLELARSFDLAF